MEHQAEREHEPQRRMEAEAVVASLQVVCAWCQQHMVWHHVPTPMAFPISYSICARCYGDVAREFAPLTVGAVAPGLRA